MEPPSSTSPLAEESQTNGHSQQAFGIADFDDSAQAVDDGDYVDIKPMADDMSISIDLTTMESDTVQVHTTLEEMVHQRTDGQRNGVRRGRDAGLAGWFEFVQLFDLEDNNDVDIDGPSLPLKYAHGPLVESDCEVCFSSVNERSQACCHQLVCETCMVQYLTLKINEGMVHISCPVFDCDQPVTHDEIISRIKDESILEKYRRYLTNANSEPNKKTCPHCSHITEVTDEAVNKFERLIICGKCSFHWCFKCHSPSHPEVKCKNNIEGFEALRQWSKDKSCGQRNARKCPKCKLFIQKISGCDHMRCVHCNTNFCYKCGGQLMKARFLFGNHYDKFSIFGCKNNFMDGRKKHLRRLVRGSIFSGKVLAATVASAVVVGLLPVIAVAALFAGPIVGFSRIHRYLRHKRSRFDRRQRRNVNQQLHPDGQDFEIHFREIMRDMVRESNRNRRRVQTTRQNAPPASVTPTKSGDTDAPLNSGATDSPTNGSATDTPTTSGTAVIPATSGDGNNGSLETHLREIMRDMMREPNRRHPQIARQSEPLPNVPSAASGDENNGTHENQELVIAARNEVSCL